MGFEKLAQHREEWGDTALKKKYTITAGNAGFVRHDIYLSLTRKEKTKPYVWQWTVLIKIL